ncbi:hypothetical protein [Paenibacillus polymyxa]|uniref:hypothetical protein n=1 Tax=Paenibacillus polymyxa TaxID=1406 RepID=UPI00211D3B41|nr:hypothetical protein [Paenibacillus polymyxa]WOZ40385.1 hypothetical protein RQP19_10210 [Paenibacillus polymyxa]
MSFRIPDAFSSRRACAGLFRLLHAIPHEDDPVTRHHERSHLPDDLKPGQPQRFQRPRRGSKEVDQGFIVERMYCQITNNGSHAQRVGAQHKAGDHNNKVACREKQERNSDKRVFIYGSIGLGERFEIGYTGSCNPFSDAILSSVES